MTGRGTWAVVACAIGVLLCLPGMAAADRGYTVAYSENHQGDITGTGNTLLSCFSADTRCAAARAGTGSNLNNNDLPMDWVDVDNDPATFNSSAATLGLPAGARVLKALLIYSGRLQQGADSGGFQSRPAPNPDARNQVLFRPPKLNAYVTLTAPTIDEALDYTTTPPTPREYQGVVDVTNLVAAAGPGEYTVANVQLGTGLNADQAGGWALAVAYEDATQPMRNLTMFTGFRFVLANGPPVDIPLAGFTTPKSGTVTTTLGLVAIEGDLGLTGDSATINADASGQAASATCPAAPGAPCRLTNAANPASNFFNASISGRIAVPRRPNYLNQLGFDADIFAGTGLLANGQESTTLRLATSGDGFAPNGVSFATDLYAPSLNVAKSVVPAGDAHVGDVLTYTVNVTNTGLDAATNTVLTDAIPDGTTYDPGSLRVLTGANASESGKSDNAGDDVAEFDPASDSVVFRLGTGADASLGGRLGVGESTSIQFKVRINPDLPSGSRVINNAGVGFVSETLHEHGHVTSPDVVTPVRIPDVTIDKSHTGGFTAGSRVPFTLVVRNVGDAPTQGNVTVTDELPDVLTLTSGPTGDGWDCSATEGRNLSCVRHDPLDPDKAYPPIHFTARVARDAPDGELVNTARVDATPDGDPTNNEDTDTGEVAQPIVDMVIAKTALTPFAFPGDSVRFLLQISNRGPNTATRVRVRDLLPPGLAPVSLIPSRGRCEGTVCRLGRMRPGAAARIVVTAVAGSDTGGRRLRDVARVSAREDETTLRNNVDAASVQIIPLADIAVTKTTATPTLPAGSDVSWVVVVTNNGPSTATNVRLVDVVPSPLQLVSATPLQGSCTGATCSLGTLRAGASTQIVVIARSDPSVAGQTLTNLAVAFAREPDRRLANNLARSPVTFTAPPAPPPSDVTVTKTADAQQVNVGSEITYRITATNGGPGPAESVIVTDTPDPGLQVVSVTPSQGTCSAGVPISCQVGPLASGATATVVVVARATEPGTLRNGVTAIPATTPDGHIDVESSTSQSPPRVTLRKRASRATVRPGGTVDFVLTATARGTGTARDIEVCDRLPSGLSIVSSGGARVRNGQPCWTIGRLDAGESRALRLRVRVAGGPRRITNVATLTFGDQAPRTARARIRVLAAPAQFTG
jgi:uncharacterized repeat protein (TIGR01451 family)